MSRFIALRGQKHSATYLSVMPIPVTPVRYCQVNHLLIT